MVGAQDAVVIAATSPRAPWTFEPVVILMLTVGLVGYGRRWLTVRASIWRLASYLLGLLFIAAALLSPIDALGEQIFTVHMVQHLLLIDLAPIFILLGLTRVIMRPITRRTMRLEQAAGKLAHPVVALVAYVAVMWVWHIPALYNAALENPIVHRLEHLSFMTVGFLYWWHLIAPIPGRFRLTGMGPAAYMAGTKVLVGLLGVGLAFAPEAIYAFYENRPTYWGMNAGTDQSVAGLVMATEQSVVMGIALAFLFVKALGDSERDDQRAERYDTT